MKVLELNFEKTWRGGERQSLYFMKGLRSKGVNVELLSKNGYPMQEKALEEGFKVHGFNNIFHVITFLITKGRQYDILHAETAHILTYCIITKPFHRTKVACTRRVDFVPKGFFTKVKYLLTDLPIAISHAIKNILRTFTGRNITHISEVVQVNELDKQRALRVLEGYGVDTRKKIVGTMAALEQHKDPQTLLAALKVLKEKNNNFVFLHFGKGSLTEEVRQLAEEYQLGDVYKMMGFHEQAEDFFSVFDVYVMSSEQEGLGSSVLDAFVYKVPVASTSAGGLKDLLQEGRGVMCDIKQPEALAENINEVLTNEQLANDVVNKAYDYVLKEHSMDHIAEQYVSSFKGLLKK